MSDDLYDVTVELTVEATARVRLYGLPRVDAGKIEEHLQGLTPDQLADVLICGMRVSPESVQVDRIIAFEATPLVRLGRLDND